MSDIDKVAMEVTAACNGQIVSIWSDPRSPGSGVVLVKRGDRDPDYLGYLTWRWATLDTDGKPIDRKPYGAMLYSGDYDMSAEEADVDFRRRIG